MCDKCDWPIWVIQCEELRSSAYSHEAMMVCRDIELYEHNTPSQIQYLRRLDRRATRDGQREKRLRRRRS